MRGELPESFKMKTRVCLYRLCHPSDWSVPHASRLKYRQQFNGLDKQMTGYLTGMTCVHLFALECFVFH